MGIRIEHRTALGVTVLAYHVVPLSVLATWCADEGGEVVIVNERTGGTLARFAVPRDASPAAAWPPTAPPPVLLAPALARHGLGADWDALMAEVERHGWQVAPTPAIGRARRVALGIGSADGYLTIDGRGKTVVEALGWAVLQALDAAADDAGGV